MQRRNYIATKLIRAGRLLILQPAALPINGDCFIRIKSEAGAVSANEIEQARSGFWSDSAAVNVAGEHLSCGRKPCTEIRFCPGT